MKTTFKVSPDLHPNKVRPITQDTPLGSKTDGDKALEVLLKHPALFRAATLNMMEYNGCIMVTRILNLVLSRWGVVSWPMVVRVWVTNREYISLYDRLGEHPNAKNLQSWVGSKAFRVGCGWSENPESLGKFHAGLWTGHLVLYALHGNGRAYMLDYTADQVSAPENGIALDPMLVELNDPAISGLPYSVVFPKYGVCYTPFPDEKTYQNTGDWEQTDHPVTSTLINVIMEMLQMNIPMIQEGRK